MNTNKQLLDTVAKINDANTSLQDKMRTTLAEISRENGTATEKRDELLKSIFDQMSNTFQSTIAGISKEKTEASHRAKESLDCVAQRFVELTKGQNAVVVELTKGQNAVVVDLAKGQNASVVELARDQAYLKAIVELNAQKDSNVAFAISGPGNSFSVTKA